MKRNELKQLYDYYVQHTAVVEKMESVREIQVYLWVKKMDRGICFCAMKALEINSYDYFSDVTITFPKWVDTKKQIVSVLNQRIELLRSELLKNMQKFVDQLPSWFRKLEFDYLEYRGDNLEIDIDGDEVRLKGERYYYLKLWLEN